ncbi:MAG: hypothetical protein Kow00108_21550 [Calditrichia bacterium]
MHQIQKKHLKLLFNLINENLQKGNGGPFGAIVFHDKKILGTGTNQVIATKQIGQHAEIVAIHNANSNTGRYHLPETVLLTSHFPCLMCYHAIKWAEIKKVYYIFDYEETERLFGFSGDQKFLDDLNLSFSGLIQQPEISFEKITNEGIKDLFYKQLVTLWNQKYIHTLRNYDIGGDTL